MTYAITQTCCNDATCIAVCPVNCIHPTPEEPDFGHTELLYIDPKVCIDCGACADACPVDAIYPAENLTAGLREYERINAAYYDERSARSAGAAAPEAGQVPDEPNFHVWGRPSFPRSLPSDFGPLRVAVVGTGPAGMYAAQDLVLHTNSEVTLVDRLPVAGGLMRYGVAPDHPDTRRVQETFARFHEHPRVHLQLGVTVGTDVTPEELAAHHDAVIYAVGASTGRQLDVPGEELAGSISATTFVAWYNAHPDVPADAVDLSGERAVVVGNGNVALDVARILLADPETLAGTDIADHALRALRASAIREVVLLARRGPEHAAYTTTELLALRHLPDAELLVDDHDPRTGTAIDEAATGEKAAALQGVAREAVDWGRPPQAGRRIVLRFHSTPEELSGDAGAVTGVRVGDADGVREIPAGMVLRAIGYRGVPLDGLPFEEASGTVPHDGGRVRGRTGEYVVGWIKRGPSGGIGANRTCAAETVGTLLADAVADELSQPTGSARQFSRLVRSRNRRVVDARGLAAIERAERGRGHGEGRPRVKLATVRELLAASRAGRRVLR